MDEYKNGKIERVLGIYTKLLSGNVINKFDEAQEYGVNERSIQRDIDDIRNYLEIESEKTGYSYCLAADAIENLKKYSIDATNQVEQVFTDALQLKEIKRKLLNVVINNFDMGSESYDASLFRIMVEDTISMIEFPVFSIDMGDAVGNIATQFTGEITDAKQKIELSTAISKAIMKIYDKICENLVNTVRSYKESLMEIRKKIEDSMLKNIMAEFNSLVEQCENKEKEIELYEEYSGLLEKSIEKLG